MHLKLFYLVIFLSTILVLKVPAQTFGFGCLGFVGGYGGFTYQEFKADGLNQYVKFFNENNSITSELKEFTFATGYRIGLNFFRASFPGGLIVTAKGYYQSMGKKNEASSEVVQVGTVNTSLDLDLKNWAVGFDVGWEFTSHISWKIVDGALHFNNIVLTETDNLPGETRVRKYENDATVVGYSVGTGIIIAIIKDYVSIEGLAGYTFISVDDLTNSEGIPFLGPHPEAAFVTVDPPKFFDKGGFTAVVQLNVGLPLL